MLDVEIIFTTFIMVFFAELGDKTQLVAFSMTSTTKNPLLIFIATSLALSLSSVLAASLGGVTSLLIPGFTTYIAAALFLGFGFFILFSREAPPIKECFLKSMTLENTLIHILPRLLKKLNLDNYRLLDILRQAKSHSEVFRILLKEKKLFKDDINEAESLLRCLKELEIKQDILKLPPSLALAEIIRWEEAGIEVLRCILDHLRKEEHHQDTSLQELLQRLIDEEKEHILYYKQLHREVSGDEKSTTTCKAGGLPTAPGSLPRLHRRAADEVCDQPQGARLRGATGKNPTSLCSKPSASGCTALRQSLTVTNPKGGGFFGNKFKLFFSIFFLVFVAELGDKTQIASFSLSAKYGNIFSVIIGAALALTCATLLAVLFGHLIARFVPKKLLKYLSGFLFLGTGIFMLISQFFRI